VAFRQFSSEEGGGQLRGFMFLVKCALALVWTISSLGRMRPKGEVSHLIGYREFDCSDNRGSHQCRRGLQRFSQAGKKFFRIDEGEFAEALCDDVPGTFLGALAVPEQLLPDGWHERLQLLDARGARRQACDNLTHRIKLQFNH